MYNIYSYSRLENLNQIHTQCVLSEKDDSINNVACNEKIRSNFSQSTVNFDDIDTWSWSIFFFLKRYLRFFFTKNYSSSLELANMIINNKYLLRNTLVHALGLMYDYFI